mgnify:CR=1 FL=1
MPTWKVTVASYYCKLQEYLVEADTDLEADSKWALQEPDSEGDIEFTEDEVLSIEPTDMEP